MTDKADMATQAALGDSSDENTDTEDGMEKLCTLITDKLKMGNPATAGASLKPGVFNGLPSEDATLWLDKFIAWITLNNWENDAARVLQAMRLLLTGSAISWLTSLEEKDKASTNKLFDSFKIYFVESAPTWSLEQQLWQRTKLPVETLEEYITGIDQLCRRLKKSPQDKIAAFVRGLPAKLQPIVIQNSPASWQDAVHAARLAEQAAAISQPGDTATQLLLRQQQETMHELQTAIKDMTKLADPKVCAATFLDHTQTTCQLCQSYGHSALACRLHVGQQKQQYIPQQQQQQHSRQPRQQHISQQNRSSTCFFCGKQGHKQIACRARLRLQQSPQQQQYMPQQQQQYMPQQQQQYMPQQQQQYMPQQQQQYMPQQQQQYITQQQQYMPQQQQFHRAQQPDFPQQQQQHQQPQSKNY